MRKISPTLILNLFLLFSVQASAGQSSNKADSLKIEILDTIAFEGLFLLGQETILLFEKDEVSNLNLNFKSYKEVQKYFGKKKSYKYMEMADLNYLLISAKMDYCKSHYDMPLRFFGGGIKIYDDSSHKIWLYTASLNLVKVKIKKEHVLKLMGGTFFLSTTDKDEEYVEVYTYLNCKEE